MLICIFVFYFRFREIAGFLEVLFIDVLEDVLGNFLKVINDRMSLNELIKFKLFRF